ncbi:MAG TPA: hypothetical protein VKB88_44205 [Bryobacteraceae bacterium]|nr:hypothetical protein [Bryobacteraceae bacterium]
MPAAFGLGREPPELGWDRLNPLLDRWIPQPRVLHPYPDKRFDAIHPR